MVIQVPSYCVGWGFTVNGKKKTISTLKGQNNVVTENCQMVIQIERGTDWYCCFCLAPGRMCIREKEAIFASVAICQR